MRWTVRKLVQPVLGVALSVLWAVCAFAQSTVLQGGPWAPGHAPMYIGQSSAQPIVQDSGTSAGGAIGSTLSELGLTSRSVTNTYPSADSGNGPNGSHLCTYDAPTTNPTGYHYLCLDPYALGGGLLTYGASSAATKLPLQFSINGSTYTFPFGGGVWEGPIGWWSDPVNPTGTNTFPPTTNYYVTGANGAATLIVNGVSYSDHASSPVFSVNGTTITWNAANAGFNVTTADKATITYTGVSGTAGGSVTSVAATVPSFMAVTGSPITTAGTLGFSFNAQTANTVFAAPTSGGSAAPTFRSLVAADLPIIAANTVLGSVTANPPVALAMPSCSSASSALIWTTGTGFGCNSISGGTGTPGGTSGQIQYNNAGSFGGFTVSGDGTLNTSTGALAVSKTGGVAFATSATTDTTNASNISSGTLNTLRLPSPFTSGARSGSTSTFATSSGTLTNGHCVSIDASGNLVDAGGACTTGGGGGTVSSGTSGQLTYYAASGTTVSGATTGTGVVTALGVNTGSVGAFVVNGGALGTPSSGTLTNATGLPMTTGVTGTLPVGNGGIGVATLTGIAKGNGTSAFTAATAGTDYVAPGTATTFTATQTLNGSSSTFGSVLLNAAETVNVVAAAPSSTTNFYLASGAVQLYTTNAANNWTLNLAFSAGTSFNSATAVGQSATFAMLTTQGSTAYYQTAMTIDGTSVSPKWQGGTAPAAGNASGIDIYQCTVVKTASATYTVLCSQTQYK